MAPPSIASPALPLKMHGKMAVVESGSPVLCLTHDKPFVGKDRAILPLFLASMPGKSPCFGAITRPGVLIVADQASPFFNI